MQPKQGLTKRAFDAMKAGEHYWINDEELVEIRYQVRDKVDKFNTLGPREVNAKRAVLADIFAHIGEDVHVEKPIRIDYGCNTTLGSHVFINFNWTILDCAPITIGSHVFIGPNTSFYTAHHPLDVDTRDQHIGYAEPITIGDHVWLGGNVVVLPGVSIGEGCVIGAGSVVTKSIEAGMLAFGNPCRVIRPAQVKDRK